MAEHRGCDGWSRRFQWSTWVSWIAYFVQRAFIARLGPFDICGEIMAEAKVDDCQLPSLKQPNDLLATGKDEFCTTLLRAGGIDLQVEFCVSAFILPCGIERLLQMAAALYKFGAREQELL